MYTRNHIMSHSSTITTATAATAATATTAAAAAAPTTTTAAPSDILIAALAAKLNAAVLYEIDKLTARGYTFHDAFFKAMTEAGNCGHGIKFFTCMSCSH